jgi:hypothetical protein
VGSLLVSLEPVRARCPRRSGRHPAVVEPVAARVGFARSRSLRWMSEEI